MAKLFVSYSRSVESTARAVVDDLKELGHDVWFDRALSGGQAWWDQILQNLRDADALVLLAAPATLESPACACEWKYALQLGKKIVPVLIADGVSIKLLPPDLARLQIVDCRDSGRDSALRLARALAHVPPAPPLPDPLPPAPLAPMSYLGEFSERLDRPEALSLDAQSTMLIQLKQGLRVEDDPQDTLFVLRKLRRRNDLLAMIAAEIDSVLGRSGNAAEAAKASRPAVQTPGESRSQFGSTAAAGGLAGQANTLPHEVMISNSTRDKLQADVICNGLEARGIRCWIAPRDVPAGVEYAESIVQAIETARAMVLVYSAHAAESTHVRREVERAISNGITVMTVRIDATELSAAFAYYMGSPHSLDASEPPLDQHMDKLANALHTLLSRN